MRNLIASLVLVFVFVARAASAQEAVWVQVEAHPSLRVAQQRAQVYAGALADVKGFSLGGNWYGVMLGPYTRADAERVLQVYRSDQQIPADSFISLTATLGQQFWPVGANVLNRGVVTAPQLDTPPTTDTVTDTTAASQPAAQPALPDETRAEARQTERALSADQRKDLQIALRAAGFYNAAIDGAFGPGTRGSMRDWQISSGFEDTGILTTRQRQVLIDQYNAPLISVGMALAHDPQAGIELQLPTGALDFSRYEPPFAHYDATGDLGIRVLLISQPGDQATLYGLYDIMQTLEIVPLEGPRERGKDSFTLEGRGKGIVSFTQAQLKGGQIKGFTLIWPQGDEDRRTRVLSEMQNSFTRLDAVLDPAAGADAEQSIDLISGLNIRKPRMSRSGFYIDDKGMVVTTAEAVQGCTRITLNHDDIAELVTVDAALGVALLRPSQALAPMSVAQLRDADPRLQSDVAVSGYSYEGILGAPTLTFGKLADVKGLNGEVQLARLALAALPGDAGGPVFDTGGGVVGMLLPAAKNGQKLPGDVSFAADATAIRALLDSAGTNADSSAETGALAPDDLSRIATGMTVLVSCWD
ncbi:MAG: peptidoglycan hydrolase-like protein with peptidoglycan-binding domain [Paracoccaceae bacterium]|jgi:peptidoglycan hydrolase-like protein with peptidoglycan-binding domain